MIADHARNSFIASSRSAARMEIIAMTTNSSIKLKPAGRDNRGENRITVLLFDEAVRGKIAASPARARRPAVRTMPGR